MPGTKHERVTMLAGQAAGPGFTGSIYKVCGQTAGDFTLDRINFGTYLDGYDGTTSAGGWSGSSYLEHASDIVVAGGSCLEAEMSAIRVKNSQPAVIIYHRGNLGGLSS
tara:strand:- start:3094 stop:3420 length:327 start_codon:yes stop_codon:yes gene_type:complete